MTVQNETFASPLSFVAVMHGLVFRRGSLTQMKIITFVIIKISDSLWDMEFPWSKFNSISDLCKDKDTEAQRG